ncbi:MAG: 4Fe-4S binding protein [Spirochaetales bacterium]|uniref:4Fe-4S binding protein n=1 Tax=Candidatus Thalassospirochaeta sargassi TaxID=3119039 RepID=A0AAJ1IFX1_9SPIO|nr:4Fe-4S binding protein [Spirochaetales bacterium]
MSKITKRVLLTFSGSIAGKPVVTELIRNYDLEINIFRASITPNAEGHMAIDVTGEEKMVAEGLKFIETFDVNINKMKNSLVWDENKCVSCGNCLSHCPTDALYIHDETTREVRFNGEKCIACMSCVRNCPFGACSSLF